MPAPAKLPSQTWIGVIDYAHASGVEVQIGNLLPGPGQQFPDAHFDPGQNLRFPARK